MRIVFGVGIESYADGSAIHSEIAQLLLKQAVQVTVELFGGCTVQHGKGSWVNGRGITVSEPSVSIIVEAGNSQFDLEAFIAHARFLKTCFAQESVMVSVSPSEIFFI